MSRPLVFVSCGATTVPLLGHLAQRYELVVPTTAIVDELRRRGADAVAWDAFADPGRLAAIPALAEEHVRAWGATLRQQAAGLFRFAGRERAAAFLPPVLDILRRGVVVQLVARENARALAATGRLAAVVLHEDVTPSMRILLEATRPFGIPSVHVPHGLYVKERLAGGDVHGELHADVAAVAGQVQAEWFTHRGVPPARVVVTGNPVWDHLCGARRETFPALGLPPGRVVTFAPSWIGRETPHHGLIRRQHERWTRAAFEGIARIRRRDAAVRLVIKHHPSAPPAETARVLAAAAAAGVPADLSLHGQPFPVIARSDALVALPSTLVVEALLLGTPVIVPELSYATDAVVSPPATGEAVEAALVKVLGGWTRTEEFATLRADFLGRYNGPSDGRAAARVTALVEDLVARRRAVDVRPPAPAVADQLADDGPHMTEMLARFGTATDQARAGAALAALGRGVRPDGAQAEERGG